MYYLLTVDTITPIWSTVCDIQQQYIPPLRVNYIQQISDICATTFFVLIQDYVNCLAFLTVHHRKRVFMSKIPSFTITAAKSTPPPTPRLTNSTLRRELKFPERVFNVLY